MDFKILQGCNYIVTSCKHGVLLPHCGPYGGQALGALAVAYAQCSVPAGIARASSTWKGSAWLSRRLCFCFDSKPVCWWVEIFLLSSKQENMWSERVE
jgi:hypothetical protein